MKKAKETHNCKCKSGPNCNSGAVYGMGLIASLIYFLQNAQGLVEILLGIGKAILWPAFVVYKLLGFLGL
jgi:hypothetical protein